MPKLYRPEALDQMTRRATRTVDLADTGQRRRRELLERARHLAPIDRRLLELHLGRGATVRELADLYGRTSGTVCRRINTLITRLESPIVRALLGGTGVATIPLSAGDRRLALDYFLNRRGIRELAREHHLTPPIVRKKLTWVRGWMQGRRDGAWAVHVARQRERVHSE